MLHNAAKRIILGHGDQVDRHCVLERELVVENHVEHAIVVTFDVVHEFQDVRRCDHTNGRAAVDDGDMFEAPILEQRVHVGQRLADVDRLGFTGHDIGDGRLVLHARRLSRMWRERQGPRSVSRVRVDIIVKIGTDERTRVVEAAICTERLTKDYGGTLGLDGLDLEVCVGEVFGFLGPNGAGKTTAIRLLLDLIRPTGGRAQVLGLDPHTDGVTLRRRIGYLPGDFLVDGRQTSFELLSYLGNLRGGVPAHRIEGLAQRLELDLGQRIKTLSKGNRQKIGLIQAVMHDPELLVLDEPTSGLDPFLQHEFAALAKEATADGRTVFMSSHVMSEVQQTADRVGIIRDGRLVTVESVEDLRERSVRTVSIQFDEPPQPEDFDRIPGISDINIVGQLLTCRLDGRADALIKEAARHNVITLSVEEADLEELFFQYYDRIVQSNDVT